MTTQSPVPAQGKILVLDDNPIIQRVVYFALRDYGFKVLMAGEVTDALKLMRAEQPNLVLVDLSFPLDASNIGGPMHDGFFFMDWIRRTPGFEKIPIVTISATEPAKYKERADGLGINACLQKPLDKDQLLKVVQTILAENTPAGQPGQP